MCKSNGECFGECESVCLLDHVGKNVRGVCVCVCEKLFLIAGAPRAGAGA